MSDADTVKRMLNLVDSYDLSGREFVHGFTDTQLAKDFNGIGPAWFPDVLREALDELHADLMPAAFVHDVRWSHGAGTYEDFTATNGELTKNGITIANARYGWYDPRRWIRRKQAKAFGALCQEFGWYAYKKGVKG